MRKAFCLLLLLAVFTARAQTNISVVYSFVNASGELQTVKQVVFTPLAPYGVLSNAIVVADPVKRVVSGATLTNAMLSGYAYRVQYFTAPTLPASTTFTNYFPTNTPALVFAKDYVTLSTNLGNGLYTYSQSVIDAKIAAAVDTNGILNTASNRLAAGTWVAGSANGLTGDATPGDTIGGDVTASKIVTGFHMPVNPFYVPIIDGADAFQSTVPLSLFVTNNHGEWAGTFNGGTLTNYGAFRLQYPDAAGPYIEGNDSGIIISDTNRPDTFLQMRGSFFVLQVVPQKSGGAPVGTSVLQLNEWGDAFFTSTNENSIAAMHDGNNYIRAPRGTNYFESPVYMTNLNNGANNLEVYAAGNMRFSASDGGTAMSSKTAVINMFENDSEVEVTANRVMFPSQSSSDNLPHFATLNNGSGEGDFMFQPDYFIQGGLMRGNAAGLTNFPASQLSGVAAIANLPTGVVTNYYYTNLATVLRTADNKLAIGTNNLTGFSGLTATNSFQPTNAALSKLAANDGSGLTNCVAQYIVGQTPTNGWGFSYYNQSFPGHVAWNNFNDLQNFNARGLGGGYVMAAASNSGIVAVTWPSTLAEGKSTMVNKWYFGTTNNNLQAVQCVFVHDWQSITAGVMTSENVNSPWYPCSSPTLTNIFSVLTTNAFTLTNNCLGLRALLNITNTGNTLLYRIETWTY